MKNIIAAAILGASIVVAVLLFIQHEDVIRAQDHRLETLPGMSKVALSRLWDLADPQGS
jgi:hypothetical protein